MSYLSTNDCIVSPLWPLYFVGVGVVAGFSTPDLSCRVFLDLGLLFGACAGPVAASFPTKR